MLERFAVTMTVAFSAWTVYLLLRWRNRFSSNRVAQPGTVFVCQACGKRSRDRNGTNAVDYGWDQSCRTWALLCREESLILGLDGRVSNAVAA